MAIKDVLDRLELSDEDKALLISEHEAELQPFQTRERRNTVDQEIEELKRIGFSDAPGALAYYRRVMLSDDGEPGLVLLSDDELGLSGDDATGHGSREEVTTANVLRNFVKLLPKTQEGKLMLSDQAIASEDRGRPSETDEDNDIEGKYSRSEKYLGRKIRRRGQAEGGE